MDNITHTLTGAVAAKLFDAPNAYDRRTERALFWTTVLAANAPDADVIAQLFGDRMFAIEWHRGITHSLIAAPVFAVLPALLFWAFNRKTPFAAFWVRAVAGVLVHILFDVITSYGTKIFLPFDDTRYAFDWMFIVDPLFTVSLGVLLYLQRRQPARRRPWAIASAMFVLVYLSAEAALHARAKDMFTERLEAEGRVWDRMAVFPQPFSVFRWMGAAHTDEGAVQSFFSVFDATPRHLLYAGSEHDTLAVRALKEPPVVWYTTRFARIPYVKSVRRDSVNTVDVADLQFSFDRRLAELFGMRDAPQPFVMSVTYDSSGTMVSARIQR